MQRTVALVFLILFTVAGRAAASEQSERAYSRGLVEFHAERYTEALARFDEAVRDDAQDVYARYYRGVTHGRLADFRAAIDDLRAALAMKPDLVQAPLELGVALVHNNDFGEAIPWLEQAQRVADLEARASLFLGIAQLRLERLDGARENFQRAGRAPSLEVPARYYQGVVAYRQAQWTEAEQQFAFVASAAPGSAMGREAATFLDKIRRGERPTSAVYGELGFQYDTNVVLAPSDEVVKSAAGISRQQDERVTLTAGGTYTPWRTEHAELSLGYEFYQSLHFELQDFNIQNHRPSAELLIHTGRFKLGMLGRYDYYFLRDNSFLQSATALPWLEVSDGLGRTEVYYRMRRRDFFERPFNPLRDAFNHAAGLRRFITLGSPNHYLLAGYQFDRDDPINASGNEFAYDGNQVEGGVGWTLPAAVATEVSYTYRHERYARQSNGRRDDEHRLVWLAEAPLTPHVGLTVAYFGIFNNSNDTRFEYDRHIVSLSVGVRF